MDTAGQSTAMLVAERPDPGFWPPVEIMHGSAHPEGHSLVRIVTSGTGEHWHLVSGTSGKRCRERPPIFLIIQEKVLACNLDLAVILVKARMGRPILIKVLAQGDGMKWAASSQEINAQASRCCTTNNRHGN